MSMMCSQQSCKAKSGLCGHEKMMIAIVALMALGGAGHWALHWF